MSMIVSRGGRLAPVAVPDRFFPLRRATAGGAVVLMLGVAGCAAPGSTGAPGMVIVAVPAAGLASPPTSCSGQDVVPAGIPPTQQPTAPTTVQDPNGTTPAWPQLQAIVQRVASGPADPLRCGRYDYVPSREWTDVTSAGPDGQGTSLITRTDYLRFTADDGSARVVATRQDPSGPVKTSDDYPPGKLPTTLAVPLNARDSDPGILAHKIHQGHPSASGAQLTVRTVADIYGWQLPARDQRAALARVLCDDARALIWRGAAVDRQGRPGVAVSIDSNRGAIRDLLLLDPATGGVLAYEQVALRNPGALDGPFPRVLTYRINPDRYRTTDLP